MEEQIKLLEAKILLLEKSLEKMNELNLSAEESKKFTLKLIEALQKAEEKLGVYLLPSGTYHERTI